MRRLDLGDIKQLFEKFLDLSEEIDFDKESKKGFGNCSDDYREFTNNYNLLKNIILTGEEIIEMDGIYHIPHEDYMNMIKESDIYISLKKSFKKITEKYSDLKKSYRELEEENSELSKIEYELYIKKLSKIEELIINKNSSFVDEIKDILYSNHK